MYIQEPYGHIRTKYEVSMSNPVARCTDDTNADDDDANDDGDA